MKSQVHFEGVRDLGNGPYTVEIFTTHSGYVLIIVLVSFLVTW